MYFNTIKIDPTTSNQEIYWEVSPFNNLNFEKNIYVNDSNAYVDNTYYITLKNNMITTYVNNDQSYFKDYQLIGYVKSRQGVLVDLLQLPQYSSVDTKSLTFSLSITNTTQYEFRVKFDNNDIQDIQKELFGVSLFDAYLKNVQDSNYKEEYYIPMKQNSTNTYFTLKFNNKIITPNEWYSYLNDEDKEKEKTILEVYRKNHLLPFILFNVEFRKIT